MRPLIRYSLALLLASLLTTPAYSHESERIGTRLELLQAIDIPANSATARLQYGHLVARNGVQEQDPFCVFEIETVAEQAQRVEPDHFTITRINRSVETLAAMPVPTMPVGFLMDEGLPSQVYYKTTLRLRSERQPGVRSLTCMSNQMMPGTYLAMRHLSLSEIRAALGGYFRFEPAGSPAY